MDLIYAENELHTTMQIGEMWQSTQRPTADDVYYARTRGMLDKLGLQNYTKNFKRGLLTDSTLPLLTDRQVVKSLFD